MTRVTILYDGECGLCRSSVRLLQSLDWLHRLIFVNFHDEEKRKIAAPHLSFSELHRALHVILPDGRTLTGFDGLRALSWQLPPLWPLAPLLYLPFVAPIGRSIYAKIALRRKQCNHVACR